MALHFFDDLSERLYKEIPVSSSAMLKLMLNIDQFNIGQSYVTAKVENRYGEKVNINIEGGRHGIELQPSLFNIKDNRPQNVFVIAKVTEKNKILVRKLPVLGIKDWLLIYDDTLFLLAVKDAFDELEFRAL